MGTQSRQIWLSPGVCRNSGGEKKDNAEPDGVVGLKSLALFLLAVGSNTVECSKAGKLE